MRKNNIFYIFYAFLSLLFCNTSFAGVTIGVPLTEDASCSFATVGANYNSDWSTTCTLSGYSSINVKGIGVCSSRNEDIGYVYSGSLAIGGTTCWCRMLLPVVSRWVAAGTFETEALCYASCANRCKSALYTLGGSEPSAVKKGLLGTGNLMYE